MIETMRISLARRVLRSSRWALAGLFVIAAAESSPQEVRERVVGRVVERGTNQAIMGAWLRVAAQEAFSDQEGRFELELVPGSVSLVVEASGYAPQTLSLEIGPGPAPELVIPLDSLRFEQRVDVTATIEAPTGPGPLPMRPTDVMTQAGALDNVFRSLQTLAGVAAADEFDSRLSVRGGGPDQNLTVMDGIEIHNPYRLFGLTSAFNPETVADFDLSTGAFGVRHGDRLSSLLVVGNRTGDATRAFGGSAALAITDANVVLEGRLPGEAPGAWLVTARRTYYDLVAERFVDEDLPSFGDVQTKLMRELGGGRRITLTGLLSRESTDASFSDNTSPEFVDVFTRARNDIIALDFETPLGAGRSARTIASYYNFSDEIDFAGELEADDRSDNANPDLPPDLREVVFTRVVDVRDLALRQEFLIVASGRHLFDFGAELHGLQTRWAWEIPASRNPNEANGSSVQGGSALPDQLDSRVDSTRFGAWLADRFQVTSGLTLEPGVRVDRSTINARTLVSPRLAVRLELDAATSVRGAFGLHSQSPGYEKTFQNDYFVDLSDASGLKSERSTHVIFGIEHDLRPGLQLRVEGYYKRFDDLILGRLETDAERRARVDRYDFPPELQSSVPSAPQITTIATNDSGGRAYGIDVFLSKRAISQAARLSGWLAYTWGLADRDAYGRRVPFDYDRRHSLNLVGAYRMTPKLDLALTARVASGFPYTPAQGAHVVAVEDPEDPDRLIPRRDIDGNPIYGADAGGVAVLNTARLPYFARLDARLSFRPSGAGSRWLLYLEVINVLGRYNVAQYGYDIFFDDTGDPFLHRNDGEGGIPRLPTFGARFRF
jgi:hypothetical protein